MVESIILTVDDKESFFGMELGPSSLGLVESRKHAGRMYRRVAPDAKS